MGIGLPDSQAKRPHKNQRGQAAILMGMMILTFLFLFQFVINTGLLVNAKINLQNAADFAAYAGAATQARQLNQIGYLNYEMRRQYKKFLFRYYILGNIAQQSAPPNRRQGESITVGGDRIWKPRFNQPDEYGVPAVCIIFNAQDNYCQVARTATIDIPPLNPVDPISNAT